MENQKYIKTVIEQFNKNPEMVYRINNKSDKKKNICEMAGIILYDKDDLIEKIKKVSDEIISFYKNPYNKDKTDSYLQYVYQGDLIDNSGSIDTKFFLCKLDLIKIKNLFIFISIDENSPNSFVDDSVYVRKNEEYDFYVLNADYNIVFVNNGSEYKFKATKKNETGYYEYATIYINFYDNVTCDRKEMMNLILHEVQHIYDSLDYATYAKMNADTIFSGYYDDEINSRDKMIIDNLLKNRNIDNDSLNKIVNNLNFESIRYLLNNYIMYLCNISEMNARLINFKKDIDSVDFEERKEYIQKSDIFKSDYFRKHSKIYNEYYLIFEMMKIMQKPDFNVAIKRQIAKFDIREIFDYNYTHKRMSGYMYDKHFKNRINKYDESSFDMFCEFIKQRIYKYFLSEATVQAGNETIFEKMIFPFSRKMR